jgi:uncharacterized protein (TIGR03083 family)
MDWIAALDDATGRFAAVLEEGDLSARVPACPEWSLADLGEHLRGVHVWAAHAVTEGNPDGEPPPGPLDREALVAGYRAAAKHLVELLAATDPDAPAWAFGPRKVAGFWRRRQVHETTMHLLDALASQDRAGEWDVDPELAWDGVDEVATMFYPRQVRLGRTEPLAGTVRLLADDVGGGPVELGAGEPVATVSGRSAYLFRLVWKRASVDDPVAARLLAAAITP